jgi:hypothetical protein
MKNYAWVLSYSENGVRRMVESHMPLTLPLTNCDEWQHLLRLQEHTSSTGQSREIVISYQTRSGKGLHQTVFD